MKKIILLVLLFSLTFNVSFAETRDENLKVIQSFKNYFTVPELNSVVPTVVDLELSADIEKYYFGVYNVSDDIFEPYSYINEMDSKNNNFYKKPINTDNSYDDDYSTYREFSLDKDGNGYSSLEYAFSSPIKSNSVTLVLDQYVALPNFVTIKAVVNGEEKIVLYDYRPSDPKIYFPETVADVWKLEFRYSQPLRISEIRINDLNITKSNSLIRFLSKPDKEYVLYTDAEVFVPQVVGEKPNLYSDNDNYRVSLIDKKENTAFVLSDIDNDGVADIRDNCVRNFNPQQEDENKNGRGDACDDFDRDGVINSMDNCINETNRDQTDIDNDGIGDTCDGEESRITEKYPFIVWGSLILASCIFIGLFVIVVKRIKDEKESLEVEGENKNEK